MAEAHKCDRCETLYEPEKGTMSFGDYHVTIKWDTRGRWWQQGYQAELCPACSKEFLKFIKHGVVRG